MKLVFADTGYWIALLSLRDALRNRALELSQALGNVPIFTSEMVLTEVLNSFAGKGAQSRIAAAELVALLSLRPDVTIIPQSAEMFSEVVGLYYDRPDKDWSLTDCASFTIMRRYGIDAALTHDKHFEQAGFQALLRIASS